MNAGVRKVESNKPPRYGACLCSVFTLSLKMMMRVSLRIYRVFGALDQNLYMLFTGFACSISFVIGFSKYAYRK